jgi:hypothetical protein
MLAAEPAHQSLLHLNRPSQQMAPELRCSVELRMSVSRFDSQSQLLSRLRFTEAIHTEGHMPTAQT